ncbi:MAG: hypothetical protein QX189_15450, partial [Methylococcales bacterium]
DWTFFLKSFLVASWKSFFRGAFSKTLFSLNLRFPLYYFKKLSELLKKQIGSVFNDTWQNRISNFDKDALQNRKFCFLFICGGGSQIAIYKDAVNDWSKKLQKNLRLCGFSSKSLSEPRNFEAPDLPPNSFHRMAVAYGLSFPPEEIGKIIPKSEIPNIEKAVINRRENDAGNYEK